MPVNYPPDMSKQLTVLFQRDKLQGTNRDLGQSSMSPGDGLLEIRDGGGRVAAGLGDLPDNTVGLGIFRNGTFKNVNSFFYDMGQIDTAFSQRDARLAGHDQRLDQKDANDASHQGQLNTLRGDITRLDGVDASIGQQLGDRPTYSVFNGAVSSLSGRVDGAQSTANGAQSAANAAQSAANAAASAASSAQSTANDARSRAIGAAETASNAQDRISALSDLVQRHERYLRTIPAYGNFE